MAPCVKIVGISLNLSHGASISESGRSLLNRLAVGECENENVERALVCSTVEQTKVRSTFSGGKYAEKSHTRWRSGDRRRAHTFLFAAILRDIGQSIVCPRQRGRSGRSRRRDDRLADASERSERAGRHLERRTGPSRNLFRPDDCQRAN